MAPISVLSIRRIKSYLQAAQRRGSLWLETDWDDNRRITETQRFNTFTYNFGYIRFSPNGIVQVQKYGTR